MEKIKSFLKNRRVDISFVIALILLSIFTGINFWLMISVVLIFVLTSLTTSDRARKCLGWLIRGVFLIFLFNVTVEKFFPRVNLAKEKTLAYIDQKIFSASPSETIVLANDIFEKEKNRASENFLKHYKYLLSVDSTEQAADTLAGFKRHWDFEFEKEELKEDSSNSNSKKTKSQPINEEYDVVPDRIFSSGIHYIDVNGITPFNIIINPSEKGGEYSLVSENYNFKIIFSDGDVITPGIGVNTGYRPVTKFRLKGSDRVKLVVS